MDEPVTMVAGGPTQIQLSPTVEAGSAPIRTVLTPGPTTGPPTCGIGGNARVCMGHVCMSVSLEAGGIFTSTIQLFSIITLIVGDYDAHNASLSGEPRSGESGEAFC